MTKEHAFEDMYEQLYYNEGPTVIYKLTNSRDGITRDMAYIAFVNGRCGNILTWGEGVHTNNVENEVPTAAAQC